MYFRGAWRCPGQLPLFGITLFSHHPQGVLQDLSAYYFKDARPTFLTKLMRV
jgi:hypothetical protein